MRLAAILIAMNRAAATVHDRALAVPRMPMRATTAAVRHASAQPDLVRATEDLRLAAALAEAAHAVAAALADDHQAAIAAVQKATISMSLVSLTVQPR